MPATTAPPDSVIANTITTNDVLVLEQNQDTMQQTAVVYPDISFQPDDQTFIIPVLVNQNGDLLYGYYDETGSIVIVGTDGDATGPNGERLTLIPADEYNQPLTQTQAFSSIASSGTNLQLYPLVDETGAILYGYYDDTGAAARWGASCSASGRRK